MALAAGESTPGSTGVDLQHFALIIRIEFLNKLLYCFFDLHFVGVFRHFESVLAIHSHLGRFLGDDGFMKYLQTGSLILEVFGESTYDPAAVARTKRGQRRLDDRAMQLEDQAAKLAAAEQRLLESTKISSLGASSVGSLMLEEEEEAPDSFSPTAGSPSKAPEAAVDVNRQLQPTEADNDLASRKEILRAQIAEEEALRKLHESKSAWEKEKVNYS